MQRHALEVHCEPQALHCTSNVGPIAMHEKPKANPNDMQPKSACDSEGRREGTGERERDGEHLAKRKSVRDMLMKALCKRKRVYTQKCKFT